MKPKVLISACLVHQKVRYNGMFISSPFVDEMQDFVEYIPVCPEVEIGLGVPRAESKLLLQDGQMRFLYTKDLRDYTEAIRNVADKVNGRKFWGIILKSRSPSCGIGTASYYRDPEFRISPGKTNGIFADEILTRYPGIPWIDEGRLHDEMLRYEFWTKVFFLFEFDSRVETIKDLLDYHSRYKFLFFTFSLHTGRRLGSLLGNHKGNFREIYGQYRTGLTEIAKLRMKKTLDINVMYHFMGYFSKYISSKERQFLLQLIEKYRKNKIQRNVLLEVMKLHVIRFDIGYLKNQKYFDPFPRV